MTTLGQGADCAIAPFALPNTTTVSAPRTTCVARCSHHRDRTAAGECTSLQLPSRSRHVQVRGAFTELGREGIIDIVSEDAEKVRSTSPAPGKRGGKGKEGPTERYGDHE